MNINIKDVLTLDDNNKYVVVSKVNYEDDTYFYLININTQKDFKILRLNKENNKLAEFDNQELIKILIPLFFVEFTKKVDITEE